MVYFQDLRYCLFFYEVVLGGGVGCSAFEMQKPKKFVAPKRGGGGGGQAGTTAGKFGV